MVLLVSLRFVLFLFLHVGNCIDGTCNNFYVFVCFLDTILLLIRLNLITSFIENGKYQTTRKYDLGISVHCLNVVMSIRKRCHIVWCLVNCYHVCHNTCLC